MNKPYVIDTTFTKVNYQEKALTKADYEACTFIECNFSNTFLDNQNFVDCEFIGCDLTNANIAHTTFNVATFTKCKLLGLNFVTCNPMFLSLHFKDCNLSLSNFSQMDLNNIHFIDCSLEQVDFTNTQLISSVFKGSNLKNCIFSNTNLDKADLTTVTNLMLNPEENSLKKTRINLHSLPGLLKKYDIVVEY